MAGNAIQPSGWLEHLEQMQRRVLRATALLAGDYTPSVDLTPAARDIERAVALSFDAYDHRAPGLASTQSAYDALRSAHELLTKETGQPAVTAAAAELAHAAGHLGEAQKTLEGMPVDPRRDAQRGMRASGDVPRLHHLERPSLTLQVKVPEAAPPPPARPEPLKRPTSFEELHANVAELERRNVARGLAREAKAAQKELDALLAAEAEADAQKPPPKGFAADAPPAQTEQEFVRERTRYHFEEVSMLGLQRAPMFGDRWRDVLHLEQRMLRAIDAIVAMGPEAIAMLEPLVFDSPVKDATRVFAIAMTLGCVRGRDALAAAERVFFDFEHTDETSAEALAAALKLVPHDQLVVALHSLLASAEPAHRAIAIDVLGHRGLATEEQLLTAANDVAAVAAKALPYLAMAYPARSGPPIDKALADPEADRGAVWLAMALAGHRATRSTLTDALRGEDTDPEMRDRAALLLALCGDQNDGALLRERAQIEATPGVVSALGWVGDPVAFPLLLGFLEHDDEAIGWAAGGALDRITGAWLVEHAELEAEEIFVEIPPEPETGIEEERKLARIVSDPRDQPPEPATETVEQPCRDPARWTAWIAENGQHLSAGKRFRRGQPYTPNTTLQELDAFPCLLGERRALVWELIIRTGGYVRLDPHDFVRTQEAALAEWAPLAARSVTSGSWNRPGRR